MDYTRECQLWARDLSKSGEDPIEEKIGEISSPIGNNETMIYDGKNLTTIKVSKTYKEIVRIETSCGAVPKNLIALLNEKGFEKFFR